MAKEAKAHKIMEKKDGKFTHLKDEKGYVYKTKRGLRKGDFFEDDFDGGVKVVEVVDMEVDELGGIKFHMMEQEEVI